ncbi:unnamed protein product [Sordaria macrospora k-hell]|uniref:WGS project CABT00000000 data, contig 2.6 n=1 Tax=Sordaria macrospora (strain ATCC MYA-333 / DSM 997 / K(L3346) / K-hell) TaxID=771870 RepID=F7VSK1_SORMK|nr:uncharacterized protein SMAC_06859 [Sordaria macrospora k-hell]CCC08668.1 unnamed protein product [Sordaria macrospora k-hell]
MDSWAAHSAAPANLKFENPVESLLATPGEIFPEVFGSERATSATPSLDIMSPASMADDAHADLTALASLTVPQIPPRSTPGSTPAPETEKKPVKKRKSWGQVLPEPKTNLPPRKRAKTEDEKEQRRVERVLRNRRAAQSSRERKRLEVEGLEKRNKELEALLMQAQQINQTLIAALRENGVAPTIATRPGSFDGLNPTPVTFSQELFSSQDGHNVPNHNSLDQLFPTIKTEETVNPASLSPALTPIPEMEEEDVEQPTAAQPVADTTCTATVNTSPDATQHPAAVLCGDLQCRSAEVPRSKCLVVSQQSQPPSMDSLFLALLSASAISWMISLFQRPLMLIATSMKRNFSLPPAPAILMSIVWLVTTPKPFTSRQTTRTSSTNSSTPNPKFETATSSSRSNNLNSAQPRTRHSTTLRIRTLRKILTSSPILARPLMDATMEVLRWVVSEEGRTVPQVSGEDASAMATADRKEQRAQPSTGLLAFWPKGAMLPSKEVLLTLIWTLRVEERKMRVRAQLRGSSSKLCGSTGVPSVRTHTPTTTDNNKLQQQYKLKVIPRRKLKAGSCALPKTHLDTERRRMS